MCQCQFRAFRAFFSKTLVFYWTSPELLVFRITKLVNCWMSLIFLIPKTNFYSYFFEKHSNSNKVTNVPTYSVFLWIPTVTPAIKATKVDIVADFLLPLYLLFQERSNGTEHRENPKKYTIIYYNQVIAQRNSIYLIS